jgi:hypothetical protein
MKTLNKKILNLAVFGFIALASSAANAGHTPPAAPIASLSNVLTDASYLDGAFSFQGENGVVSITYSGATPTRLAVGGQSTTPYPANQNYSTVGSTVQTVFGLPANPFVGSGFQVDEASTIMSGSVAHFLSTVAYQYLAVHFGKHELLLDFGATGVDAGTAFDISTSGSAAGLSNFRAYSTTTPPPPPPVATPIPAAIWLFGSGLAGLLGMRRKKSA